jgi:hypothetical protein
VDLYPQHRSESEQDPRLRLEWEHLQQEGERRRIWVRKCRCGRLDLSEQWDSPGAADRAGVWRRSWKCPECGGTVFELASIDERRRTTVPEVFLQ